MNSGRQALELYQTLNNQQKRFLNEKDLEDTKTLQEWLAFLDGPVKYDELIDKTTQTLKRAVKLLWVFAAFNLIVAVVTQSWYLGLLAFGMAFLALYQRFKRSSYFKRDLHNHLRLFFFPVLEKLSAIISPTTDIKTRFWLREKDQGDHIIVFSLEKTGRPITVFVKRDSYTIESITDGEAKVVKGKSLRYSDFIADFEQV